LEYDHIQAVGRGGTATVSGAIRLASWVIEHVERIGGAFQRLQAPTEIEPFGWARRLPK